MNELLVVGGIIVAALLLKKKSASSAPQTVYKNARGEVIAPEKVEQAKQALDTVRSEVKAKVSAMNTVIASAMRKTHPFGEDITDIRRYQ